MRIADDSTLATAGRHGNCSKCVQLHVVRQLGQEKCELDGFDSVLRVNVAIEKEHDVYTLFRSVC